MAMNKKGFKWKTLINDPETAQRYQIMQMSKPADLEVKEGEYVAKRKIKVRQEPVTLKGGIIMRLFRDVYKDITERQNKNQKIEIPYCMISALQKLKQEK